MIATIGRERDRGRGYARPLETQTASRRVSAPCGVLRLRADHTSRRELVPLRAKLAGWYSAANVVSRAVARFTVRSLLTSFASRSASQGPSPHSAATLRASKTCGLSKERRRRMSRRSTAGGDLTTIPHAARVVNPPSRNLLRLSPCSRPAVPKALDKIPHVPIIRDMARAMPRRISRGKPRWPPPSKSFLSRSR